MEDQEIYKKIVSILTTTFKINAGLIKKDSNLHDALGLDSVDLMDVVCVLEQKFKVKIIEENSENVQIPETMNDLVVLVSQKIKEAMKN
jgi:acyl carrier protein